MSDISDDIKKFREAFQLMLEENKNNAFKTPIFGECPVIKSKLIQDVLDWQADYRIEISNIDALSKKSVKELQEMISFYEDGLKNGKRL